MPRRPRLEVPGLPLHITHRGVNRAATFLDEEDFVRYPMVEKTLNRPVALRARGRPRKAMAEPGPNG